MLLFFVGTAAFPLPSRVLIERGGHGAQAARQRRRNSRPRMVASQESERFPTSKGSGVGRTNQQAPPFGGAFLLLLTSTSTRITGSRRRSRSWSTPWATRSG